MSAPLIDVNVTLGRWPLRRLPHDETSALVALLRERGVTQAWAGVFDGLLHKDIASANAWLAEECRKHGHDILLPFGSINPTLPQWEVDLRRCAEDFAMRGIRLHPNYHGYTLDNKLFREVLDAATASGLLVQLAASMEDERMMHPLLRVPNVELTPLPELVASVPKVRIVVLNALRSTPSPLHKEIARAGDVCFDIAALEGVGGLAIALEHMPAEKLVLGSHAPLFYVEAALLKLRESRLDPEAEQRIRADNAAQMLTPT